LIGEAEKETDIGTKRTKIGVILNGTKDDKSWGQSHYEGLERCKKNLKLDITYKEKVPADMRCIKEMEKMIADGCEIIICNSFDYGEYEQQVAKENPDVYFFHATGVEQDKNLSTYFGRIYQMRYLAGIVAGLQTTTNQIGYVAAFPIAEVNRGINAFTLGARSVNPDANVYVKWCGTWTDATEITKVANGLLDTYKEIDVVTTHEDSLAVYQVAEERGIWCIGYNMDNSQHFPKSFLTAPVWDWEQFYRPRIKECLQGKFRSKHYWEGSDSGVVSLAPLTDNVKSEIREVVEEKWKQLEQGKFDVFYGPIKDNQGNIRIAKGENMSDDAMLNSFDWYVEGVVDDAK